MANNVPGDARDVPIPGDLEPRFSDGDGLHLRKRACYSTEAMGATQEPAVNVRGGLHDQE